MQTVPVRFYRLNIYLIGDQGNGISDQLFVLSQN